MSQPGVPRNELVYNFTVDDSLASWNMPVKDWLAQNRKDDQFDGLATGNIVFSLEGKVLVIQRAANDSLPNKWEFPGGAADDDDPTIFHAAARELWEESGLVAKRFTHIVTQGPDKEPGETFQNRNRTKTFVRFAFHVEVESCDDVKLDPNEHQNHAWASEEDIRQQKLDGKDMSITRWTVQALFLEAFRLRRKKGGAL